MEKEKHILKFTDQEQSDPEGSNLSNPIEESLMNNNQDKSVVESLEQLIDFGEDHGQITHKDIFRIVPKSKEDQELLEEILDMLISLEIQIVEDETSFEWDEGISSADDKADESSFLDVSHLKEELQKEAADVGDTVGLYLSQVSMLPLLDRSEEVELAKRIERGRTASKELAKGGHSAKNRSILTHLIEDGHAAREHLLLANVRLVFSVAKKYMGRGIPLLDLVQEGHIGLMRATTKFDYHRGHKFSTYATWWIRQAVSRYVADQGRTVRLPVHMGDKINKMLRVRHRLLQKLGHEPTIEELAHELNETPAVIDEMLIYSQQTISLDLPVSDDEDATLADFIESEEAPDPEEITTQQLLSEHVSELLAQLPPREALILRLRFGLTGGHPHTLNEIGSKLGITRERVRQIEAQARHRIRGYGMQDHLREYLEN